MVRPLKRSSSDLVCFALLKVAHFCEVVSGLALCMSRQFLAAALPYRVALGTSAVEAGALERDLCRGFTATLLSGSSLQHTEARVDQKVLQMTILAYRNRCV